MSIYSATYSPWLGVQLKWDNTQHSLVVNDIHPQSPLLPLLKAGDQILALYTPQAQPLSMDKQLILLNPGTHYRTYLEFNQYFATLGVYYDLVKPQQAAFWVKDQGVINFTTQTRSPQNLPATFWNIQLLTSILLVLALYTYHYYHLTLVHDANGESASSTGARTTGIARLLLLAAVGLWLGGQCSAAIYSRDLFMHPTLLRILIAGQSLGASIFIYSLLGLLWGFPKRISPIPLVPLIYAVMALVWINQTFQIIELSYHAFVIDYVYVLLVGIPMVLMQWRNSRSQALHRAQLKWFLFTLFISISALIFIIAFSKLLDIPSLWSVEINYAIGLWVFLGAALGLRQYKLYMIEKWWPLQWLWFTMIAVILMLAFVIYTLWPTNPIIPLAIALLITSWYYHPIRLWYVKKFVRHNIKPIEKYLSEIIHGFFAGQVSHAFTDQWSKLLNQIFKPVENIILAQGCSKTILTHNGYKMVIPAMNHATSVELTGCDLNQRLFTQDDCYFAEQLHQLILEVISIEKSHEGNMNTERNRILRDLNDDVSTKLLSIITETENSHTKELANAALQSLNDTVYGLDFQDAPLLDDALKTWKQEISSQLHSTDIALHWNKSNQLVNSQLTKRQFINVGQILREAVSNAIQHAHPSQMSVEIKAKEEYIYVSVSDDGQGTPDITQWHSGQGLHNIHRRATDIMGEINWIQATDAQQKTTGITLELLFPLELN